MWMLLSTLVLRWALLCKLYFPITYYNMYILKMRIKRQQKTKTVTSTVLLLGNTSQKYINLQIRQSSIKSIKKTIWKRMIGFNQLTMLSWWVFIFFLFTFRIRRFIFNRELVILHSLCKFKYDNIHTLTVLTDNPPPPPPHGHLTPVPLHMGGHSTRDSPPRGHLTISKMLVRAWKLKNFVISGCVHPQGALLNQLHRCVIILQRAIPMEVYYGILSERKSVKTMNSRLSWHLFTDVAEPNWQGIRPWFLPTQLGMPRGDAHSWNWNCT